MILYFHSCFRRQIVWRGEFRDLITCLGDALHRLFQWQQFRLQLVQTVGRTGEPAGRGRGERINSVTDCSGQPQKNKCSADQWADVHSSQRAHDRAKQIAQQ